MTEQPVAYTNVTQDDWVMAEPKRTDCAIQFCPARSIASSAGPWYCAGHRWPGGAGNASLTVISDASTGDSAFVDGVEYIVNFQHRRAIRGRFRGAFVLDESTDTRLVFTAPDFSRLEVDPDFILSVVAPS